MKRLPYRAFNRRQIVTAAIVGSAVVTPGRAAGAIPLAFHPAAPLAQEGSGDVPMDGGNPGRTGEMPGPVPDPEVDITIRWQVTTQPGDVRSTPAVVDGTVYFGSDDGHVYAVSLQHGREKWRFPTGDRVSSNPAVVDGAVLVGSQDGYCYAIDTDTGFELWRYAVGGYPSSPLVASGIVVIAGEQDKTTLRALNAKDGSERWRVTLDDYAHGVLAAAGEMVYLSTGAAVRALDLDSGSERWSVTAEDWFNQEIAVANDTVYASGGGVLMALNAADGTERWRTLPEQFMAGTIAVVGDTVFVGSREYHTVAAANSLDGRARWLYSIDGVIPDVEQPSRYGFSHVSVAGDTIIATRAFGQVYAFDARDGTHLWEFSLPTTGKTAVSSPVVIEGLVLIGSQDGTMYALGGDVAVLGPGGTARVTKTTALRSAPSATAPARATLEQDIVVTISDESVEDGDITWWVVFAEEADMRGWVEASVLEPLSSGPMATEMT